MDVMPQGTGHVLDHTRDAVTQHPRCRSADAFWQVITRRAEKRDCGQGGLRGGRRHDESSSTSQHPAKTIYHLHFFVIPAEGVAAEAAFRHDGRRPGRQGEPNAKKLTRRPRRPDAPSTAASRPRQRSRRRGQGIRRPAPWRRPMPSELVSPRTKKAAAPRPPAPTRKPKRRGSSSSPVG